MYKLHLGNNKEVLKDFAENSIDSIVTDPPYELGFMGKSWDSTGIAYDVELWKECLRVLKPGGYILAFSGTRTYHRMAVAIEDAGFEIRDMIEWVYGSGFPKSLNIGKKVDEIQGNEREDVGEYKRPDGSNARKNVEAKAIWGNADGNDQRLTKGTSEHEGWGTALKPAHEPICMARKPLAEKTVAENCLKYGTGGINIDESRIFSNSLQGNDFLTIFVNELLNNELCQLNHLNLPANSVGKLKLQQEVTNVIKKMSFVVGNVDMPILEKTLGKIQEDTIRKGMLCSDEILTESMNINLNTFIFGKSTTEKYQKDMKYIISTVLKMITDWKIYNVSAYQLIEVLLTKAKSESNIKEKQGRFPSNFIHDNSEEVRECFPDTKSPSTYKRNTHGFCQNAYGKGMGQEEGVDSLNYGDSGNASRFFKSIIYEAKASKAERNRGCEAVFNLFEQSEGLEDSLGGSLEGGNDKRNGDKPQLKLTKNNHPTVKPIALMEYLIKMVTPKGGVVLDPFNGSGSTGCAAVKNGFDYHGIDITKEYITISEKRIKAY